MFLPVIKETSPLPSRKPMSMDRFLFWSRIQKSCHLIKYFIRLQNSFKAQVMSNNLIPPIKESLKNSTFWKRKLSTFFVFQNGYSWQNISVKIISNSMDKSEGDGALTGELWILVCSWCKWQVHYFVKMQTVTASYLTHSHISSFATGELQKTCLKLLVKTPFHLKEGS